MIVSVGVEEEEEEGAVGVQIIGSGKQGQRSN
jgi:hypothetical protein